MSLFPFNLMARKTKRLAKVGLGSESIPTGGIVSSDTFTYQNLSSGTLQFSELERTAREVFSMRRPPSSGIFTGLTVDSPGHVPRFHYRAVTEDDDRNLQKLSTLVDGWLGHLFSGKSPDEDTIRVCVEALYATEGLRPAVWIARDAHEYQRMREVIGTVDAGALRDFPHVRYLEDPPENPLSNAMKYEVPYTRFPLGVYAAEVTEFRTTVQDSHKQYEQLMRDAKRCMEDVKRVVLDPIDNVLRWEVNPHEYEARTRRSSDDEYRRMVMGGWFERPARGGTTLRRVTYPEAAMIDLVATAYQAELKSPQRLLIDLFRAGVMELACDREIVIVCPLPSKITMTNGRLHGQEQPAVQWQTGFGVHFLYGVWFPERLYKLTTDETAPYEGILQIVDIDQRMAAMRHRGPEKLLPAIGAELVARSERGNELHKVPREKGIFRADAYFLKYTDPSTGRVYVSGVPHKGKARETNPYWNDRPVALSKDPDTCMAWKFHMTTEEYAQLQIEA